MPDVAQEFIPTRRSLLGRLKDWDDQASWREFFNTYWKLIYGVSRKAGLAHTEAEDVVQETVLAVAKSIGRFKYNPAVCSFKTWLLHVTRSKIARQFQKRARQALPAANLDDSSRTPLMEKVPDPAADAVAKLWDWEWRINLLDAAMARVKHSVSIEHYQMFDLAVVKKWPARRIADTLG
jgi:RNA polymerase sigma-70 factor (ECF subfamily)